MTPLGSYSMSNLHLTGFQALLVGVAVDDAESPNLAPVPRVVLYGNQGLSTREALCTSPDGAHVTIQSTCVGETREQAGLMLDQVTVLVQDKRPVVIGWTCGPVQMLSSNLPIRDDDVDPAVFYAVATWRFHTVPTA